MSKRFQAALLAVACIVAMALFGVWYSRAQAPERFSETAGVEEEPSSTAAATSTATPAPAFPSPIASDDVDSDGVTNDMDNCPFIVNADQADTDADSVGDACDPGSDAPAASSGIDAAGKKMVNTTAQAVQTCYQSGVPHTDSAGRPRTAYGPGSFFPNGVFWLSDHPTDAGAIAALSAAGFNTALTARNADVSSLLAQITDNSFKLIVNEDLLPGDHFISQASTFDEALFQRYKGDPRVLAWWLDDEPLNMAVKSLTTPEPSYDAITGVYQRHRSQTEQPFFITEASLKEVGPWWQRFLNLGDIASTYFYPKTVTWRASWRGTADSVRSMVQAVDARKPAWFVLQSWMGVDVWVYPTPLEERAQVYTAIIHGATGLLHFAWDSCTLRAWDGNIYGGIRPDVQTTIPDCPDGAAISEEDAALARDLWGSLDASKDGINKEIRELTPVILSPTSTQTYFVYVDAGAPPDAPVRTMLKYYRGEYYLLAVNLDAAAVEAKFVMPFVVGNAEVMFESRAPGSIAGFAISDEFSPFDVNVYKLTPATSRIAGSPPSASPASGARP
jgi:hypothetical protein